MVVMESNGGIDFDILKASVSVFEERRDRRVPIARRKEAAQPVTQERRSGRTRRFVLKGGHGKEKGKHLFIVGHIERDQCDNQNRTGRSV